MRIGGGRPARKQKFQIDPRRWRLKLHENGTQGAVAIGAGHLQLVSGNQMETHLLNAIVNHGFFRLGSPSEFCHTCGYGHPIPSIHARRKYNGNQDAGLAGFFNNHLLNSTQWTGLLDENPVAHSLTHPFLGDEITKYYVTTEAFSWHAYVSHYIHCRLAVVGAVALSTRWATTVQLVHKQG